MKNILLLGSTGSIGKSTLDVVSQNPDEFRVRTLVTNTNISLLADQITRHKPDNAIIFDYTAYCEFEKNCNFTNTHIGFGNDALYHVMKNGDHDNFINAFVGFAGLEPTARAIDCGLDIALANKETLVVAGELIMKLINQNNISLLPIDSEHSAIWQCLVGEDQNKVKRIILTASGGPFRTKNIDEFSDIKPEEALHHPNWDMGAKITIDSATMMNKGLEVIEAYWLYNIPLAQIEVVIHPQSIIHSMVEFTDHSIKAQLGMPDMRIPIQYALSYPRRLDIDVPVMDFKKMQSLTFESPDTEKFPCLKLAYQALENGMTYPAALNAANEVVVAAFLEHKIKFLDIPAYIDQILQSHDPVAVTELYEYVEVDKITRVKTEEMIKLKQK
jgi:1-deoxy-D-xylulose-5-phosphate reductoisomerase